MDGELFECGSKLDALRLISRRGRMWPVSIAPMMDWTDRHYRFFIRQITRHTLLYTEMKTTGAVLYGDRRRILGFSPEEKPLVLQLGGDQPAELAACARIAEEWGYDEINLNVGCPSNRVQKGNFGACLMSQPELVAESVEAMRRAISIPVTVKHRIGIDDLQDYEYLVRFVETVSAVRCDRFIIHARIALLQGLSPKANRTIPPLRYRDVYALKREFPNLIIEINGEIKTLEEIARHLQVVDGAMLGRAAYENPYLFATVDSLFYGADRTPASRREIIEAMIPYIDFWIEKGLYPNRITRHMMGLFSHQRGSRCWKRYLSENAHKPGTRGNILLKAIKQIPDEVLDAPPTGTLQKNKYSENCTNLIMTRPQDIP